jgi:hypothetical protein
MVFGPKNVAKDGFLHHPNNNICFKIHSVKIEHYFKGIVISNNPPFREIVLHKREGLPIKLSIESFFVLAIECKHKVLHEFKIPIESTIQWKIANGVNDGVFKHSHGVDTKYLDNDNNDCVIYYFPKDGIEKNVKVKEIPILVKINPNKKNNEYNNSTINNSVDINNIGVCDYEQEFILTLSLKQKEGILNKMLYEISSTVKEPSQERRLENLFNPIEGADENNSESSFIYRYQVKDNKKTYSVFRKSVPSCKYCNLYLSFNEEYESTPNTFEPKMDIKTDRFFTSEYIKVSNNHHHIKNICKIKGYAILFDIKSNYNGNYRFGIINSPTIKTSQTFWASTAGSFPCGNSGDCVIYHSPLEKELSKSPVTLTLFEKKIFVDSDDDKEPTSPVDQKKIWLLRRITMGG